MKGTMDVENVKVNSLAEFCHYYNLNTDMILEKIDLNKEAARNDLKALVRSQSLSNLAIGVTAVSLFFAWKKIHKLNKRLRELEDQRKVDDFLND